jgi:DNA polymerase III subunit delta'
MPELIFHPSSKQQLDGFIARPSHALVLVGPEGMGKNAVSRWLSIQLLGLEGEKALGSHPYVKLVVPDGQSISIEAIRELLQFTKLKIAGSSNKTQRIVVIDQSHVLTGEAQNALLKLLEEPPEGTVLILTAVSDRALLPTIRSRSQIITLQPPANDTLQAHFENQGYGSDKIRRAYLMSGGLPGLMHALLEDSEEHPLVQAAEEARSILKADTFERLALVDRLSKQRTECSRVIFMLEQMAQAALKQTAGRDSASDNGLARWHRILEATYDAETALLANAQPKLVLTNLMLCL